MSEITDKTDYYEIFGVEETASQEQLKKAYRKAAMKWHPDRNHNNVEEATRVFQIIEHAYSILSDPHERAWYDGHRHAVVNEFGEFDATNVDIEGLFGAGAFSGYNDGPNGFYTVFQKAFQELADEEKTASKIPIFGDSKSPYEKVAEFYNFWTCFTTKRSFAFKDIYHLKDAPNARYKRAMNQENEKARQKAQRDFVQSVRELALFAKKRDPRVKKHLEEVEKQNEERRRIAEQKKLERQKEVEKQLESILNDNSNPISYNENDIIYLKEFDKDETEPQWHCDYCGRDMNTESAFKQHCNTKKHKKLSASARKDFLRDPSLFEHTKYTFMLLGITDDEIEDITGRPAHEFTNSQDQNQNQEEEEEIDEDVNSNSNKKSKKGKQNKKQNQNQKKKNNKSKNNFNDDDEDDDDLEDEKKANNDDDDDNQNDDDEIQFKNGKNKNNKNQNNQGKKGKGKNQNQNQNHQNQNNNNQQKVPKKEKHKQKMQRQKEAREKAELEELEKQKQKQKEEKEKIESIISKSQSSDQFSENINTNNDNNKGSENESDEIANHGPKLSKKEKKRLRQLEEARKRFLIQDEEEEDAKDKEEEKENENEAEKEEENKEENQQNGEEEKAEAAETEKEAESTTEAKDTEPTPKAAAKKNEKVIEIIDENGKKVKVTMTDNFDDEPEVNDEDNEQDDDQNQNQAQSQTQNQNQNQRFQGGQPKGKKNKKGPKKAPPGMFMCRKCHAVFPSKTKLFKHLEETNHATAYG